jgi:hypothetical protein
MTVLRTPSVGTDRAVCVPVADWLLVAKRIVLSECAEAFNGQILCSDHHFLDRHGRLRTSLAWSCRRSGRAAGNRCNAQCCQYGERRDWKNDLFHNNPDEWMLTFVPLCISHESTIDSSMSGSDFYAKAARSRCSAPPMTFQSFAWVKMGSRHAADFDATMTALRSPCRECVKQSR